MANVCGQECVIKPFPVDVVRLHDEGKYFRMYCTKGRCGYLDKVQQIRQLGAQFPLDEWIPQGGRVVLGGVETRF